MATALSYVADQVRKFDRDRFVTALFAPAQRREALFALYAFNVEVARVREIVTEPMLGRIRLQWWRDLLETVVAGGAASAHPVAEPLGEAMRRFRLNHDEFLRLLDAREGDLDDGPPPTLAALEHYAGESAGTLTRLALEVLDVRTEPARAAAHHVGVAWALTGLLRAVPFHASAGRLYLPAELLERHGVAPRQVLAGTSPPGLRAVASDIATRAGQHLDAAARLRDQVPRQAVPALLPAALARRYLAALKRRGQDPFAGAWAAPRPRPVLLSVAALLGRY